jgi:hypothetical protein
MLTKDELPRPTFGCAAGEHGGQSPNDLSLLPVRRPAVLVVRPELLQSPTRAVQSLSELLGRQITLRALVRDAPELARLELDLIPEPPFVRRTAPREGDGRPEEADRETGHERSERDRRDGHPVHPR